MNQIGSKNYKSQFEMNLMLRLVYVDTENM